MTLGLRPGDPCPRCGAPISSLYIKRDRKTGRCYLYAEHYDPNTKRKRSCYLGPANGYEYARLAPSQVNLLGSDYEETFRWALADLMARARAMAKAKGDPKPLEKLAELLEEYALAARAVEKAFEATSSVGDNE